MSAIRMKCRTCGAVYFAGMVGSTPWAPHVCPLRSPDGGPLSWADVEELRAGGLHALADIAVKYLERHEARQRRVHRRFWCWLRLRAPM